MNGQIFISYRRDDSKDFAGRIYDRLTSRFPPSQIFIDVDSIGPGVDFVEALEESVGSCDVLIAVIGKRWLASADQQGNRRLDKTDDFVRLEIATALRRNILVIPVLHDEASMPQSSDLPEDLRRLAHRNALEMSHTRFSADLARLIGALEQAFEKADAERKWCEEQERLQAEERQRAEKERLQVEERRWKELGRLDAEQRDREEQERPVLAFPPPSSPAQPILDSSVNRVALEPSAAKPSEVGTLAAGTPASAQPVSRTLSVRGQFGLMIPGPLGPDPLRWTFRNVSSWLELTLCVALVPALVASIVNSSPRAALLFSLITIGLIALVEWCRRKLTLAKASRKEAKDATELADRGRLHFLKNKPAEALSDFDAAIRLKPELSFAWLGRGLVHCSLGSCEQAVKDFSEAIRLMPKCTDAYNNRGVVYLLYLKDFEKAVSDFNEVIRREPKHSVAYRNRSTTYERLGNRRAAQQDYWNAEKLGMKARWK